MTAFAFEQYRFTSAVEGEDTEGTCLIDVILENTSIEVRVKIPGGFYKLLKEVVGVSDFLEVPMYCEKIGNRYILGVFTGEDDGVDLWYYVPSNTPYWLDNAIQRSR